MGVCCSKCKNEENLETVIENQERDTVSTIINQPSFSNSRPNETPVPTHDFWQLRKETTQIPGKSALSINTTNASFEEALDILLSTTRDINPINYPLQENTDPLRILIPTKRITNLPKNKDGEIKKSIGVPRPTIPAQPEKVSSEVRYLFRSEKITRNIDMLKELLQALDIPKLYIPINQIYSRTILDEASKQYKFVRWQFRNKKFNTMYEIKRIEYVWNPYSYLQYKIMQDKLEPHFWTNRMLFHGTQTNYLDNILAYNFDWRKIKQATFGRGVYFANNPWYASHYSARQDGGNHLVMILARVIIGSTTLGHYSTIVPIAGDTTSNPDKQVLVKYDDACFYPEYVICFEKRTLDTQDFSGSNLFSPISVNEFNGIIRDEETTADNGAVGIKETIKPINFTKAREQMAPTTQQESTGVIFNPAKLMMSSRPYGLIRPPIPRATGMPIRPRRPMGIMRPRMPPLGTRAFKPFKYQRQRF